MSQSADRASPSHHPSPAGEGALSGAVIVLCAAMCGAMAANIYYAQTLIGEIAPQVGLSDTVSGLIVTLTQLGYGLGLMLMVPLADKVANRPLIITCLLGACAALVVVALARSAPMFLAGIGVLGVLSAGAQVVVPYVAGLCAEDRRGAAIGKVMSGLLGGILLARPAASFLADLAGWRTIFALSAVLMLTLAGLAWRMLPARSPHEPRAYAALIGSTAKLLVTRPMLRRRAIYQGLMFASFNILWTATPLMLASAMGLSQMHVALFALAGAGGALVAPYAGKAGDRGHARLGTRLALALGCAMALLTGWGGSVGSIALLVLGAFFLDVATQCSQVLGQKVIYSLKGATPGRLNSAYMTVMFVLGGGGAALATAVYHSYGFFATMGIAAALPALALAFALTEPRATAHEAQAASQS
ncbi:MFS transporter [Novosphingobium sp. 1949]|uniref:MFS transporter n=1 Tax=Novosphingobium organovorum TaxID=2930092 RepID=A0ABT0BFY3_9SPHN|nr:MFS transporter [Novosphingobium organovorum]MCJ2183943.1 MFS transporter [Novosphingobium organovorum]